MKKLFLLRHAQTEDKQSDQKDFDRMLTPTGLQNATRMGMYFKTIDIQFDIIISSPAERALNTASLIAEQIKYETSKIHLNEEIYESSSRLLLQVVVQLKDEWNQVLLVGHNPPITYVAEYLTGQAIGDISTCGLVEIDFNIDSWSEISEGTGELKNYVTPESLKF